MDKSKLIKLLTDYSICGRSDDRAIDEIENVYNIKLPDDYRELVRKIGSGEGFIKDHYIVVWSASEVVRFNYEYEVDKYAPGLMLFGSNGGGEGFAYDIRNKSMPVVEVPFVGMDLADAKTIACSITELFTRMANEDGEII